MGDLEPFEVNIGPIYAQNLSLKNFTVTPKIYSYTVTQKFLQLLKKSSYSRKAPKSHFNQQVWVPDKFWKQNR